MTAPLRFGGHEEITRIECSGVNARRCVEPAEFEALEEQVREIGYSGVLSGLLVRSFYRAGRLYRTAMDARKKTS